jgi:pimeloyl-ACP methyl ester carboxylesterase
VPIERIVMSIHGMRSQGEWQVQIVPCFEGIDGLIYRIHNYGYVKFYEPAIESQRDKVVAEFVEFYKKQTDGTNIRPSIIAHSYGTWILCEAMSRYPEMRFDRMILCGSVVECDFKWAQYLDGGKQVFQVLNEKAGSDDTVARLRKDLYRRFLPGSGPSGLDGFSYKSSELQERSYPKYEHSDAFVFRRHCERVWRPFIFGESAFAEACSAYLEKRDGGAFSNTYLPVLIEAIEQYLRDLPAGAATIVAQYAIDDMARYGAEGTRSAEDVADMLAKSLWKKRNQKNARR